MRRAEFVGVLAPGSDCGVVAWFVTAGAAVVLLVDDDELVDDDAVCANAGAAASAMAATPNNDAVSLGKFSCAPPICGASRAPVAPASNMLIAARKLALNRAVALCPQPGGTR
jgi:hypothetical protein